MNNMYLPGDFNILLICVSDLSCYGKETYHFKIKTAKRPQLIPTTHIINN